MVAVGKNLAAKRFVWGVEKVSRGLFLGPPPPAKEVIFGEFSDCGFPCEIKTVFRGTKEPQEDGLREASKSGISLRIFQRS